MPIAQKILLHILLLACPAIIAAQPGLLEICPDSLQGQWEDDFGGWAYCVPDAAPEATFGEVRSLPLRPYSPDSLYFLGHRVQWLYFKLKNCSAVDSLRCFVTFGIDISTAELRYCRGGQCGEWEAAYGGRNLDYENLAFPLNNSAIPIKLGKRDSAAFYLRLHLFQEMSKPMPPVRLVSPGTEERQRKTFNYEKDGFQYFFGFFMGILAVMGLFGFVIYLARKDKAYLFYSLYLLCLFVFYFKIFESYNRSYFHFSLLAKWAANLESSLSIACFIVYLQFARYFLRMDEAGGRFSKWVKYGTLFFCSLFFADLLVQAVYGPASSIKVLKVLVPLILIFCFVFMVDIWRNLPSVLPKIFIASNCFLIAPIFVMRVAELAAVPYDATLWGTMRVFHLGAGDFCFLHTKTGMLLEITGFLIGLAWKTREERLEMMNLAIALRARPATAPAKKTLSPPLSKTDEFLLKANAIVEEHYAEEGFSVNELVAAMNLSYSHFANTIKKKTGLSPSRFIQKHRLQKAAELLLGTDRPVQEIAYSVGFNSPSYFTRLFSKTMGMPPSDYRKNGHFQ